MRKFRKITATAVAIAGLSALLVPSAQAHLNFGQIPGNAIDAACTEPGDALQPLTNGSPSYEVNEAGTITSWSINAGNTPNQQVTFKLFRHTAAGYTVVAHDGPKTLAMGINTFKVAIPALANDFIGFNLPSASEEHPVACAFLGNSISDEVLFYDGNAADGALLGKPSVNQEIRLNLAVTLLQKPEISIPGRVALGSITGGGKVVLQGNHFEEVSGVSFGGVAAKGFTVENEHQLTAIAPPGTTLAEINAAVTTPAGTATAPSRFSYSGCVVPKLKNKKLSAAKAKITKAGCKVGKIKRVRGSARKRGKVVQQSPKPGKVAAPGTKVSLKVGR